ncbi:HigA family addiction module antitoxin [Candidatus Marithioploca araucensis]|uniref:HigA family addiction module antitoxin n=1 Tax=Candidatus Marithioploca araucensis TaxID=70273 RepID=A0ABT7VVB1_9GAMM|nr:HigA family addiction module antitoxin [Candidatus Marithioploca araucensis]
MNRKNRPTHPGKFVKEDILKELDLTQTQLANALGLPRHTINQLVNEKCDLTADMALRLSLFTKTTHEMWLNHQLAIELWDAYHSPYAEKIEQIQPYATMCLA